MEGLTAYGRFAVICFTVGSLVGSLVIGYLMLTPSPLPVGPTVISFVGAVSPACIIALVIARSVRSMSWLLAPTLLIGGLAVPLDFAFACLLGFLSERGLQMTIAGLLMISMVALAVALERTLIRSLTNKALGMPVQPGHEEISGAAR